MAITAHDATAGSTNGQIPGTDGGQQQTDGNASFLRAARAGNLEKVLDYLKGSIDINTSNANGLNALHLAAKEGHVNVVNELLKRGANVNATTKKGNSALHIASLAGQEEVVKLLVQKQANVNVQSQNGFTPLYMAAQENHDGVVRFLLANGANQSLATEDGFTPLAVALQQGHDKVVAVLLENDARGKVRLPALHIASKKDDCKAAALLLHSEHNPDVTSKSGFTPLHIAAHYGNSNIASLLLEKGADVNFPAKHQITPLHVAAKWGKSNMVKLLLEKGAKMDASTRDGLTPLHCAARSGHDQVVEQLLEKNAPITAKTKNGLAPLHMASQGDHVDSARILLYHKAPVDDVTVDYLTALHVAAHCGHVGVAKLLLDRRADPNARALNGFTPLHIACKKNRIKVVELLLKHGASIEATTESGLTPLHVASFMGCMNIVIYLIQHGANPDIPTVRGETPLHLAARANQTDIIRILLRNGAHVDAKARELQTALHIASRLGNADMVGLLLQHGAAVDAPTKDAYTPLHVAAREGQDEVAALLLDHGAALAAPTKKGFTPLHLAAKYGNLKVAQLLLQKDAPVDAQGKNGVTPLHVAAHYDHVNVALLLLEKGASPHSAARNGYTPLHVAARKDQMDIASSLLEYGAKPGAESRAGFTPLHLAAQEGHADLAALLVEHGADCDAKAKNGLTPMHLCAQEDRVEVATILAKHGASLDPTTKAGYTPLHVACHFGQTNMIRFLLRQGANVNATTSHGYTPLHQAAQQGHTLIINLLLEHRAAPNAITNQGQTALAIAQRLGYISVVETLKVVTETIVTTTTTTVTEEKYRVVAPETMHETFMSDSEDEAAEDNMLGDQSFRYLTADEMKSLGDDSLPIDVTRDERITESIHITREPGHAAPLTQEEERLSPTQAHTTEAVFVGNYAPDNVDLSRTPIHAGFLVSFLVDARGGAMRGCRHSGVRVIIPPRKAQMPMRITCRYLRKEKLPHPPPLLEGEACASRILEVGPAGAKFLGPVILEVPHFASLRGKEREISILRSDNGETWKEHTLEASEEAVQEVLNESFEGEELSALEDLQTNRIVRILTTDFPQYFAVVSRTRQEVHAVGPEGGLLSSTVVPQVQAIFPEGALTKKIRVGLQAQPIPAELVTKLLGHRVAVSPIVTVEPRRRKFHKPITLTIPVPQAATKGMINQYAGDAPTLRLLCSITGGTNKAQWEDVTGSTPLTFVNDCVSFTTTVSARFWLMDCRQVSEATKFATELYAEAMHVPFMAKFVVFAKRLDPMEAQLRVFCMTDDKEDKTLESQEHFTEVAKSRDVEVLEKKSQYLEFGGNLVPVTKSGEQLQLQFQAFRENRLPFAVRVKDPHQEPLGRLAFMRQPRAARASEPPQAPLCNLNIALPEYEASQNLSELVTLEKKYGFVEETGLAKPELIHRADLRLSDIARELGSDWAALAAQLDVPEQDVASIRTECPSDLAQQALLMLRLWMKRAGGRATGNNLEKGLRMINREDIVNKCMFNVELVTDDVEKAVAKVHLDQSGFDTFREELGTPKDTSLKRDASLDVSYDEQDLMKEAESAEETSSETGSVHERHTGSEAKGTSKTIPGVRKGSPISPTVGRIVRGSSKEKTAPQMAVEETFEEEPVVKSESAEATQQAASGAGPTAPPRDAKRKSKKEKTAPGPDYSLPRIRDTPERAFESATDATAVSSVRESTSRESTPEGKAKKKKEKKEKSPSPPGPDYTLPRLRDLYTPPRDVPLTSGPPEEDLSEASLARKSKERSLSPGSLRTAENGSLGTEPLGEREAKREPRGSEDTIVEKVERVVKETPGKIVEMVHIKRQRSSKSPEGKGTPKDKKKKGFPSSDVDTPDAAGESKDVPSDSTEAKKKQKMEKESSPTKHRSKDVKEVPGDVDKEGEFSAPDGKSPDSSFLSKMAKKMFPRGGRASASDEEPSSISESSPVSKKKAGKLPKSATLPKASEKSSKMPTHGIKSVDVEVDASKLALKGTKDVPAMDADDLETSTGDVVKDSDGRFFSKMAKIPKRMFPRSSKTSSSEDEPSSASESISAAKQKGKKEPKGEISSKKKDKSLKIKQPDSKTLSGSFAVGVDKDRSSPGKEDVDAKGHDREKSPGAKLGLKIGSIEKSLPHVKVGGSVERPEGKTLDIKPLHKEPQLSDERELSGKLSSDIELSLSSKEPTVDLPEATEESFDIGTPEHGKSSKGGFMHKMAKLPRKMFSHGFKGDASVEEPSAGHEGKSVSGPELEFKLDAKASDMKGPDGVPAKEITTSQPGTIDIKAPQSDVHLKMKGKIPEKPGAKVDIAFPTKKLAVGVPYGAEKHEYQVDQAEIRASFPDRPEAGVEIPGKQISVDFPEGRDEKIEISGQGIGKPSDVGFMSKVAKLPKKMLSYGSKEDGSADEEPGAVGDVHFKMPQGHIKVDVKGSEKPDLKGDIEVPGKKATVGMPEGIEGRVELSAPEVAKPSDGGFMSKMAKLPKKMFPHGSKGGVSVEGEAGIAGDVHVKMPEAHLQVGAEGLEKPEAELDIALPKKKVGVDLPDVDGKVEISGPELSKSPDGGFISKMAKLPKKMFPHGTKDVSVEGEPGDIHVKMPEAHLKVGIEGLEKPEGEVDIALPEKQIDVDLPEGVEGKFEVSAQGVGKPSDTGFMSKMTKFPKKMFPHGTKGVSVEEEHEVDGIQVKMPEAHLKVGVKGLEKPEAEVDVTLPKKKVGVDIPEGVEGKVELPAPQVGKSSDKGFMSKMAKLPKKMFPHGSKGVSVEEEHKVGSVHVKTPEAHLKMGAKGLEKPEAELDVTLPKKKVGVDLPEGVEGKVELTAPEVPKQSDKGFMSKMKKMFPHSPKGVSGDKELEVGDVQAKMPEAHLKVGVKGFGKPEVRGGIPSPKKKVSVDLPEPVDGKVELSAPELGKSLEGGITSKMAKVPKKKFPLGSKGVASIEGAPGDVHVKIPEAHLMSDVSGMEKPEAEVDISFSDQKVDVDLPGSIEGKVELTAPEVGKPSDGGFMSKMAKLPKKMFPHGSKGGISVEEVPEVGGVHVEMPEAHLKLGVKGLEKPETEVDISIPDEKVDVDFPGGFEGKVELTGPEVGKQPDGGFMSKMAKIPKKMFPHGPKGGVSVEGELEVGDVQGSVPEAHLKMGVGGLEKPQADVDIALPKEEVEVGLPEGVGGKVELSAPELGKSVEGGFMSKMAKFPKKMFPHGSKGGVSVEEAPGGVGDVNVKMPEAHLKLGAKGPEKPDTEVDITLPDKKIDVDLPGEFEGKVELTAPEIGKPSDGGFMSKMAKLPKKMFPHGSKGGISVEEELQGVGDANVKMPEAHLKLDVAGVEKPEAEVGISLPDQKIDVDLPGGIEGEVQLKASEVGKSVDGKIASKMAKLPKKMFSHASKEEPLGDAHIKVPEAQLKFDVKGPEKPGAEVDISLPDKKVDVELPGGIEGKVEITAPEVGKSDKGFMSKMAKFPKKMFSHGSKGGSSVEEAPDGVGDVHVKIPEAHLKLDVKGLEKPEPELEKVDADFPGGIEGKVEFTSPEVGKSSDKGFMSKMAKLPKKMFPHGSKGGVSIAETSGGFGDLDVEMPEAHLKVDVKGPEKPEAHLDASLPDQKVDVGAPEGIGGKVELSAPEVGKPSDSGFMAKVAKLPKKMFPHGTKGSISVEEGAEITGDVHVEMPGARLNVEGLQKPDAEVDISLPEERLAVGLPEGVEGKVEVSAPEVGKSSPADFLSKMAKVPKKMFPLGSGGLSVEEESRVGDIHLEMPEAHLKASVEGLEKPGVEVDVAFPEKKGELPKGIQGKVEVSAPEVDKPSDGGFMSKMTKKIFSHGSKGGVSVEETSGVIGDVGIKMPEAHVKLDVKGLEKPETEAELSVRADFPGGPKGKGDMPAAKIGKPSDGALMSAETKLPEGALPDGHKAGGSIEGTLVTGKDFGADIPGVLKVEATAPKMREVDVEFSRPIKEAAIERPDDVAAEVEMGTREAGKAPDKGFISKMAKLPKKMFHHGSKGGTSTDEHSEPAEGIDVKTPELSLKLQTEVKVPHKPEDVSVSLHGKEVTVQLPEESERTVELSTRELGKHSDKGFLSKMAKFPKKMFSYSPKANISGGEPPDSFDNVHDKVTGLKVHAETDLQYKEEHANIVVPTKKVSGNFLEKTVGTVEVGTPELGQASDGHPLSRMSELPKVMLPQVPEPTLVVEQPLEACQGLRVETPGVEKRRIDVETSAGSIRDSELFRLKEKGARAERDWEVGVDHKGSILEEPLLNVQDTDISLSEQGPHKEGLGKVPEQPCAVFGVSLQGQEVAVDLTEEQGASKFGEESGRGVLPQAKNIPKEVLSRDSKEAAALEVSLRHNKDTHFKGPQTELNLTGGVGPRKKAESDLQAKKGYAESAVVTGEMGTVEIGSPELGKQRGGSIMSKIAKLPKKVFRYSSRGEVATVSAGASGGSLKIKSPERTNVKLGTSSPGGKMNQGVLEASLLGPEKPSGGTVAPAALADVKISEVPKCHLDASVHPEITSTAPPECTGESTNGASPDHSKPPRRALETAMAEFPEKAILLGSEGVNSGAAEADFERQRKSLQICTTDVHASVPKAEVAVEVPQVAFVLPQHEALLNESLVSDLPELSTAGVSIHKTPAVFGNVRGQICHLHHKTPEAEIDGSVSDSIITDGVGFRGDVEISAPKHARPSVKPDTGSPPVSDADAWAVELIDVRIPKPEARVQVNVGIHDEPHELSEGAMSVKKTSADLSDIPCETVSKHTVRSKFSDDDATVPLKENISFEASSWPSEASGSQAPGSAEHFKAGVSVMEKPLREDAGNVQEVSRGTVDIIAPKLGKPKKRGFMSKMAKFPPKMFSRGSKEIASVEKPSVSTEGTDLSISRSGAHTKEGVKVAEKPKDIVDASQSEARISVDVLDDSQKRIGKASTPERSQSQEKGLIGKMSKLPKKMFSHGSKRGAVKEEFPVGGEDASCKIVGSEGFGAMTVSDEKGELDNNLSEQKAFEERPERCKDTANVILPTTGHSSMRTLSEMTKLQENVVPHGPKVHDTVEMPYVGSEGVFPDVLATIPSRETDISLIGKAMAVDIPESHEAAIDLCVADHKILTQELAPLKMGERPGLKESLEIRQPGPVAGVSANSEKVASAGVQLEKFSKFPSTADSEVSYTSRATGENFVTKLTKAPSKQPLDSEGVVLFNGSSGKHFEAPVVDSTGLQKIHSSEEGFMSKECRTDIQEPSVRLRVTEIDIKPITKASDFAEVPKGDQKLFELAPRFFDVDPCAATEIPQMAMLKEQNTFEEELFAEPPEPVRGTGKPEGDKRAVVSEGSLKTPGGSVKVVKVMAHGITTIPKGAPGLQSEKISEMFPSDRSTGIFEGDLATSTNVVHVTKHEIGKHLKPLRAEKRAKGEVQSYYDQEQGLVMEAHKIVTRSKHTETPGAFIEVLDVTAHDVEKPRDDSFISVKSKGPVRLTPRSGKVTELPASAERSSKPAGEQIEDSRIFVAVGVPDKPSADILPAGTELPITARRETKETPGGVIEVVEVTTHEVSKPASPGLLSKVSKIPKKIFPRGSKSKGSDEESPSAAKRELRETPGGLVEVVEVTKHDVTRHPESKHSPHDDATGAAVEPAMLRAEPGSLMQSPPTLEEREIREVPGGVVEVVRVTKHIVGRLPEDKHADTLGAVPLGTPLSLEAELAKDPSAVVKREVKETPEGHVEVVQVIRREVGDVPFGDDFPGDRESGGTISRRIETTVVEGKPTVIRRLVTTTADGVQHVTENIEQGAEDVGSVASSLFAKMGDFAKGLSSGDSSAVTTREVKQLPGGGIEVVSITKQSSSSPERGISSTQQLPGDASELPSSTGSMHFAESAAGQPMEAKTTIIRREISGPETVVRTTTSIVTSATAPGSSKPDLSADDLDKMFGDMEPPKVDERLKDVLTGGYRAKREVTPEEAELLAQLFPEQSSETASYPPAGLVPEAAIIPEYRGMTTAEGAPPQDPESKEKVLLKLGRALSQDDLDAPSPTRGEAAMAVAGLGEAVDTSDQVEEPVVEKLELARRESKRLSQEFEQDEPLPKAMAFKSKPSEETVVSSTQVKGVHDDGTVKHTVTTVTKTTIIQEMEEPAGAPRPGESETWASDLDTSQVSVSSLPEDERTEPTLSSSATTATAEAEALSGPLARTQVEEKASKKQKKRGKKRSKN